MFSWSLGRSLMRDNCLKLGGQSGRAQRLASIGVGKGGLASVRTREEAVQAAWPRRRTKGHGTTRRCEGGGGEMERFVRRRTEVIGAGKSGAAE